MIYVNHVYQPKSRRLFRRFTPRELVWFSVEIVSSDLCSAFVGSALSLGRFMDVGRYDIRESRISTKSPHCCLKLSAREWCRVCVATPVSIVCSDGCDGGR